MLRVPPAARFLVPACFSLLICTAALVAEEAYSPLAPGLAYRHEVRPADPLSIHVIRAERQNVRWDLRTGLGQDAVFGLEPLDGIVERTATRLKKPALAAINGDFFVIISS